LVHKMKKFVSLKILADLMKYKRTGSLAVIESQKSVEELFDFSDVDE